MLIDIYCLSLLHGYKEQSYFATCFFPNLQTALWAAWNVSDSKTATDARHTRVWNTYFGFSLEETLVCRKSDTKSLHSLTISISQCSERICQISGCEDQTQTTVSASNTTAARSLTHTFPMLSSGSTLFHHHSICQTSMWLSRYAADHNFCLFGMRSCNGKNLTCKTSHLASL